MRARRNEQRVADAHGLRQGIVGVGGQDDVDALDAGGELAVDVEAVVREQHHHLRSLPARGRHRPSQLRLADAERPTRHHPARVGDRRVGEGLADHGNADAASLEHAEGREYRLLEVGVAHVAGKKREPRRARSIDAAEQLGDALSAQRELPMSGGGLDAQLLQHGDHVPALGLERRVGALQRIAAVEQQHPLGPALGPDRLDQRGQAVHAADAAVGLRQRLVVVRAQHVGVRRPLHDAEGVEQLGAGDVRQPASGLADAEVERRLAVVERLELRVAVGHVQDGELALGRELQQLVLADGLLRGGTAEPPAEAGNGGGGGSDLQKIPARQHAPSILSVQRTKPASGAARGRPNPRIFQSTC